MKPTTVRLFCVVGTALLALTSAVASAIPASAATQTALFRCRAEALDRSFEGTLSLQVDSLAPSTVGQGAEATIVITPGPETVPRAGGNLKEVKEITLRIPFPTSSTYQSSSLSGGFGLGTVTLSDSSDALVITATGPVAAGTNYQLPALTITVAAKDSGIVQTTLGGTSFDDPGLTLTAVARLGGDVDVATSCYPDPNPGLTSTTIMSSPIPGEQ